MILQTINRVRVAMRIKVKSWFLTPTLTLTKTYVICVVLQESKYGLRENKQRINSGDSLQAPMQPCKTL